MTTWSRLPVEERLRIRKVQTFNVVDLTIRLGWMCLWLPGACLLVALAVVLLYDILFVALPWWFTVSAIALMIGAASRRLASMTSRCASPTASGRGWPRSPDG